MRNLSKLSGAGNDSLIASDDYDRGSGIGGGGYGGGGGVFSGNGDGDGYDGSGGGDRYFTVRASGVQYTTEGHMVLLNA